MKGQNIDKTHFGQWPDLAPWSPYLPLNADLWTTNVHMCYKDNNYCGSGNRDWVENQFLHAGQLLNFHLYGCLWTPTEITIYLDGTPVETYVNNYDDVAINDPVTIILSTGTDSVYSFGSLLSNFTTSPVSMYVDWIRVFKQVTNPDPIIESKAPYIINPKDDPNHTGKKSTTIMWQLPSGTLPTANCSLYWGHTPYYGYTATIPNNSPTNNLFSYELTNLDPDDHYYYLVVTPNQSYTGDFQTPPSDQATETIFYASGNRVDREEEQTLEDMEDLTGELLGMFSSDPSSQTMLIQTNGFVSANNEAFWRDEFFNPNTDELYSKIPIIGPLSENERKEKCLTIDEQIAFSEPDGNAQNFRTYFPFLFQNPYINPTTWDYEYNHSIDYGPVRFCFPEIEYINTSQSDAGFNHIGDVASTSKDWRVLCFDFPIKSLNGDIADEYSAIRQAAIYYGAQLVIMGHEDYYAHWVDAGVHYLILGNGGSTTNGIDDNLVLNDEKLICAATVPHFAKFHVDGDLMYVDIVQGADDNGYSKGRSIEKFAIPQSIDVSNAVVWNSGSYPIITDYLLVEDGGSLTINSELQILNHGIKVKAGGALYLSGQNAKITSTEGFTENLDLVTKDANGNITNAYQSSVTHPREMWNGIEVCSNPYDNQMIFSQQGVVKVTNGATIENASVAVATKQAVMVNGHTEWKGGGILIADQANFINNEVDIEMYPYQGKKLLENMELVDIPDKTCITRSSFTTNNNYLNESISPIHVNLIGVYGITAEIRWGSSHWLCR
jgi:hypothetical protein